MKRAAVLFVVLLTCAVAAPARQRAVRSSSGNPIDVHIWAKLAEAGIPPAARAGDAEFLRRVTIDLTGAIPMADETQAFLADAAPDKRAKKIDALLASEAFNDRWTMWF